MITVATPYYDLDTQKAAITSKPFFRPTKGEVTDIKHGLNPGLYLYGPLDENLKLAKPLNLRIEHDNSGLVILDDLIFNVYGTGDTIKEALEDYKQALIEYYSIILEVSQNGISEKDALNLVEQYIKPR